MPAPCPHLPVPDRPLSAASIRDAEDDRGPRFYYLALECAQALWLAGLPAQSLLLLNRALSADLHGGEPVLRDWPLPYAAAAWIMRHHDPGHFLGNPRRHYQHLATRMVEPRKELRTWRAWACWALARAMLPDLPADEKQLAVEGVREPDIDRIAAELRRLGLPGEADLWQHAVAAVRPGGQQRMTSPQASVSPQAGVEIRRLSRTGAEVVRDAVAVEAPLEIRVEGRPVAVAMRTPGHDRELAAGFLLSEGVVEARGDVFEISTCPSAQPAEDGDGAAAVDVLLTRPGSVDFDRLTRHVFTASSCGLCGKAVVDEVMRRHPPLPASGRGAVRVPASVIFGLPDTLRSAQATFAATGGLHASALFDLDGRLIALHEDVGRHNALDKLLGECWLAGRWPLDRHLLMLSGRLSFELVQKAVVARLPVVAAISAPSSLAVATAEAAGVTLCGFVRDGRMNVYSHPGRIDHGADTASATAAGGAG